MSKTLFQRMLSLIGVKGKDGSSIASTLNPVPVEVTNPTSTSSTIKGVLDDVATTLATEDASADIRITPGRALHAHIASSDIQAPVDVQGATIQVPVDLQALYRTSADSTSTPLGVSVTRTGVTIVTNSTPCLLITSNANVAGTIIVEESADALAWQTTQSFPCAAGAAKTVKYEANMPVARVNYANGTVAQATFFFNVRRGVA